MNRSLWLAGGVAVGFLLGSRAGRAPYEHIRGSARRAWQNPQVRQATRMVQTRVAHLYDDGLRRFTHNGRSGQEAPTADLHSTAP
jgi:hypothetical protein